MESKIYSFPIHPLVKRLMEITETNAIHDPFFSRMERAVISLLVYYFESLFEPFLNENVALETLQQNPQAFQFSLDVFQKAFMELPDHTPAKQAFARTSFVSLTPGWEESERREFMHTLFGLRRRFGITENTEQLSLRSGQKTLDKLSIEN